MISNDEIIIDLGNHYVGYLSFKLDYVDRYIDAPVRLYFKFCETKKEIDKDFSKYNGTLSASWLQEEIINIDDPGEYKMPRRYAARYIKIKVLASPKKLSLSDFKFKAVSSADTKALKKVNVLDEELEKIDIVAVNTLKNCMHRIFEDGPKRDRRLWIGDLRLEALANYYTFNNLPIVRRCLYLFAAAAENEKGFLVSHLYEATDFVSGDWFLQDYSLLFVASACDYFTHTNDSITFNDIYPIIKNQMEAMHNTLDKEGIVTIPEGCDAFIDWRPGLKKITALHGVYLYVLKLLVDTLNMIGNTEDAKIYLERYNKALESAKDVLYNKDKALFVNEKDCFQYNVHSAVWMILGGVENGEKAKRILLDVLSFAESIKPFTPYMHHYVVEAMVKLNMFDEAKKHIKDYWGSMVKLGADTFWEAYVPNDLEFSPYDDAVMNSMCHAWSCTPTYFIRKYFSK